MSERLRQRMEEMDAMLRHRKREVARQQAAGDEVEARELAAITKLEIQLANLETFHRLRDATRERSREG